MYRHLYAHLLHAYLHIYLHVHLPETTRTYMYTRIHLCSIYPLAAVKERGGEEGEGGGGRRKCQYENYTFETPPSLLTFEMVMVQLRKSPTPIRLFSPVNSHSKKGIHNFFVNSHAPNEWARGMKGRGGFYTCFCM